jgi:preprotein translocase subunit YajC
MDFPTLLTDLFIIGLFAIGIYTFTILPRQRAFKERQKLVSELTVGTEVTTYGGMIGKVTKIEADQGIVHLEIANGVTVRLLMQAIGSEYKPAEVADSAQKAMK